jgi:hypothetical protein
MRKSKVLAKFRAGAFVRVCLLGNYLLFYIRHKVSSYLPPEGVDASGNQACLPIARAQGRA